MCYHGARDGEDMSNWVGCDDVDTCNRWYHMSCLDDEQKRLAKASLDDETNTIQWICHQC